MRALIICSVLAVPVAAAAEPTPVVLAVDGAKIYVDVGGKDGVAAGSELELLHVVVARDPATGKTLRDRFAIGTLVVDRVGDHLALAIADKPLVGRIAPGDQVRLVTDAQTLRDPWLAKVAASRGSVTAVAATPPAPTTARGQADAESVRQAWQATLGQSIERRLEAWRAFLDGNPTSAYAPAIKREIASLEQQRVEREAALARAREGGGGQAARIRALAAALSRVGGPGTDLPALAINAPVRVMPGHAVVLAFLVQDPERVRGGVLYARKAKDPGFRRLDLHADGDAYLRGQIPADLVREPRIEWFVETTGPDGAPTAAVGSREQPRTIAVDRGVAEAPPESDRSRVTLAVDYVDFDGGFNNGFDQYVQAELDFMYRFMKPVYAFRLGFGTLSGVGGPKDIIDDDPMEECRDASGVYRCRRVNFNYVYTEAEFRLRPTIAVMLRPQVGLVTTDVDPGSDGGRCNDDDITNCDFATGLGMRGRVRLGAEQGTNLVLGVGFTDGVGTLLEASYHWLPARVVPVVLSVQVTDQPVPENFGVRLIADAGWRGTSWFYPSLRLSYQARDIDHAGLSGGVGMNFDW